jgi:uncharacterized cupredoxin-like copper-binding protein
MNLEIKLVTDSEDRIDVDATLALAQEQLVNYKTNIETEDFTVKEAVDYVFDNNRGVRMNMEFIVGQALNHLNVQSGNYQTLKTKIHDHISGNGQGKTLTKATKDSPAVVENPNSLYIIGRGRGAGTVRRADLVTADDLSAAIAD